MPLPCVESLFSALLYTSYNYCLGICDFYSYSYMVQLKYTNERPNLFCVHAGLTFSQFISQSQLQEQKGIDQCFFNISE